MSNTFANLAQKLINNKMWKSSITINQLYQTVNQNGATIYSIKNSVNVYCVKTAVDQQYINDNILASDTTFVVAANDIPNTFNLKNKIEIIYNTQKYKIKSIISLGTLQNQDSVIQFIGEK